MVVQDLKFDERGLIPTIVQDRLKGSVLAASYMNAEALALTLQTGIAHLWHQENRCVQQQTDGAGCAQRVVDIIADSEGQALIIKVDVSPSSATNGESDPCTNQSELDESAGEVSIVHKRSMEIGLMLSELFQLIVRLERARPENSYTTHLFENGLDLVLKKLGEGIFEVTLGAKNKARKDVSRHVADLFYHLLVFMVEQDLDLQDVLKDLRQRAGLQDQPLPATPRGSQMKQGRDDL